jgi:signal transduction histidine kinase
VIDLGEEGRFLVSVAGDATEIDEEIVAFDRTLVMTFAALALVLLITTLFQVRFGLAPLKRISDGLAAIRSGAAEKLEGSFPVEIAPLARETNALLDSNREIVERARTHVGNLAHALKTPLSVMFNEANARADDPLAAKVTEQTNIMREQVTRHLERARLAARVAVVGTLTDVVPVVQSLVRTMEKTHHGKDLAVALNLPGEARFRGERQDLEEMVGNLVDTPSSGAVPGSASRSGSRIRSPAAMWCALRLMTTDRDYRRPSASRWPGAAGGSTKPSRARGWGSLLWLSSRRSTAARSISAIHRSAACAPS